MQKKLKNEKGSISLFVLLSVLFFLVVVSGVSISFTNKENQIDSQFKKIKLSYEKDVGNEENIYRENNLIKITFDASGGTSQIESKYVFIGGEYGDLPIPEREGYTFVGWKPRLNLLPTKYQEVEYIESTRTQRIKTNYIPKTNTKVVLDLSFNGTFDNASIAGEKTTAILKSPETSNWDVFAINFGGNTNQYNTLFPWFDKAYQHGGTIQSFSITDPIKTNRNTLTIEPGKVTYGPFSKTITTKTANQLEELYLFGSDVTPFSGYNMRVYGMTISEGEDIKCIYIPCYRKSDNEIGLYDIVNDDFYTNIGTGTFNKGNNVNENVLEFVTSTDQVVRNEDHTLYAVWERE